ncbi:hypothetical protein K523DRAFT_326163 [Schizophyllum commune Tattone D]|nr:hypothetical protein K523DRAFT_326163 [Schizophyllum commune Tattone D]
MGSRTCATYTGGHLQSNSIVRTGPPSRDVLDADTPATSSSISPLTVRMSVSTPRPFITGSRVTLIPILSSVIRDCVQSYVRISSLLGACPLSLALSSRTRLPRHLVHPAPSYKAVAAVIRSAKKATSDLEGSPTIALTKLSLLFLLSSASRTKRWTSRREVSTVKARWWS